jgi:Uma2 family endonuclease
MNTAEVLTPLPRLTYDDFEDPDNYEIVDGRKVELPPMSVDSIALASRLCRLLSNFGIDHNLGEAYSEMLFQLPLEKQRGRKPDVAFVSYTKWPKDRVMPGDNAWKVLPDLCVEVVSPTDKGDGIEEKIDEYIRSQVPLIWLIYPRNESVYVYELGGSIRRLTRADTLEGGVAVPGFAVPLADLFPQQTKE